HRDPLPVLTAAARGLLLSFRPLAPPFRKQLRGEPKVPLEAPQVEAGKMQAVPLRPPSLVLADETRKRVIRGELFDVDAWPEAPGDPNPEGLGDLRSARGRRHPRMRGAWLDDGLRRSAFSRSHTYHRPPRSIIRSLCGRGGRRD